ncbi:MAG TPA: flagella biosynthesis regulatory protein FliT [Buttiauxella sp.]|nr:flagella biosynthesis regulatory protein FliT [Buttiauxella sp.]
MNEFISSLSEWHELHALSQTMLDLAHSEQWDELIENEMKYVQLVENIAINPISSDKIKYQEAAKSLLVKILANETKLKILLQDRLFELRDLIDQTERQKSLNNAYGNLSGNVLIPTDNNQ